MSGTEIHTLLRALALYDASAVAMYAPMMFAAGVARHETAFECTPIPTSSSSSSHVLPPRAHASRVAVVVGADMLPVGTAAWFLRALRQQFASASVLLAGVANTHAIGDWFSVLCDGGGSVSCFSVSTEASASPVRFETVAARVPESPAEVVLAAGKLGTPFLIILASSRYADVSDYSAGWDAAWAVPDVGAVVFNERTGALGVVARVSAAADRAVALVGETNTQRLFERPLVRVDAILARDMRDARGVPAAVHTVVLVVTATACARDISHVAAAVPAGSVVYVFGNLTAARAQQRRCAPWSTLRREGSLCVGDHAPPEVI
jgi:hypothetical protein